MMKIYAGIAGLAGSILVAGAIASCTTPLVQAQSDASSQWRAMTAEETDAQWDYVLNSPLGIAALNQLAVEGFISPICTKQFYTNEEYGGFQTLLQVTCSEPRGASTAAGYDEMRVIFNRFESTIENFEVHRVYPDREPEISLPE
ncbi:MAG: hypothetical protein ACFB8W_06650 [Elainellaceae cyanobacterium]